jgi:hypothetical protein
VLAVFGTIVATTIALPTTTGGEAKETGTLPAHLNGLPPLVHIVLDEHIGLAGLPPDIEGSDAAAEALQATFADFALYRRAYSRFAETQ